jgi:hypothetical protein
LFKGAPLLWASKIQTQIELSTMEVKYTTLSQAMCDLIPFQEVLKEIMTTVLQVSKKISFQTYSKSVYSNDNNVEKNIPQSTVFEDNDACLQFARIPRLIP